jgi:hypothetical protein
MDDRKVWTTEDWCGIPEGSCIYIQGEEEYGGVLYYDGMWCSMSGSYYISVPASVCTEVDPSDAMRKVVDKYLASDEFKSTDLYRWLQEQKQNG